MRIQRWAAPLALALIFVVSARAQEEPNAGGHEHAPRDAELETPTPTEEPDGPNLELPPWLGGKTKARYEAAIASWKAAFAKVKQGDPQGKALVEAAAKELEATRELDANCALADYYLGIAYQVLGDHPQAQRRLREAIKRNAKFHEAMVELGDACRWAGEEDEALAQYGKALRLKPDYLNGLLMRSSLLAGQQKFEQAREDTQAGLKLQPEHLQLKLLDAKLKLVLEGPDWETTYTAETSNYVVRTNVSQEFADSIAEQAELIRKLYSNLFPRSKSKRKSPIVVFKDKAEYHKNGGPQGAGGHFDPMFKQLFLFRYEKESDTLLVLNHEGFHQFLDGVMEQKPPQWLNEGLADYFGPSEYVTQPKKGMRIRPNPWRTATVRRMVKQGKDVDFELLMNMTQQEMYGKAVGNHYAQAWAMVYFLCEADDRAYFKPLKAYFKALKKGKSQREAFDDSFGKLDLKSLQERWREFVEDELK
ncbi:MAG: DUF1570 domain-containing protein [Planctomycetes bacterium]|nr:DUF1570 domain-containing protein [Planctomycetota bacterium]